MPLCLFVAGVHRQARADGRDHSLIRSGELLPPAYPPPPPGDSLQKREGLLGVFLTLGPGSPAPGGLAAHNLGVDGTAGVATFAWGRASV